MPAKHIPVIVLMLLLLSACSSMQSQQQPQQQSGPALSFVTTQQIERRLEDLVSSGLGVAGIQAQAPTLDNPQQPDPLQLRRLAIYNNYRALQDVGGSGFGDWHGPLRAVPGLEILAWRKSNELRYPHAVALQLPDSFDPAQPCLVVSAASGSRGVYGAAAVSGDWALLRGCAVVYTDKAAGTGFFDFASGDGVALDGTLQPSSAAAVSGYRPAANPRLAERHRIAIKHAHSGDNPEAHWGAMVLDATRFALDQLQQRHADMPRPLTIAAGISNGGAAVLHAAEQDQQRLFDAVVAGEPNIYPPAAKVSVRSGDNRMSAEAALPLYAYATQLGLYQSCAVLHDVAADAPFGMLRAMQQGLLQQHCDALSTSGLLPAENPAVAASARLDALNLTAAARRLGMVNISLGLWPAITATYAQAYRRDDATEPVCAVAFAVVDESGQARASARSERATWFASSSGIAPTAGIELIEASGSNKLTGAENLHARARCWQSLWQEKETVLRASIAATRASGNIKDIPVLIVHGRADALIAVNHSSRPYVAAAMQQGSNVHYYEIEHAQHFDALLGVPGMREHIVAIHPYFLAALEQAWSHLRQNEILAPSQVVRDAPGHDQDRPRLPQQPGSNAIELNGNALSIPQ